MEAGKLRYEVRDTVRSTHTSPVGKHEPLVRATLACRLCGRPVGDLVGYLSRPLEEARYIPLPTGALPRSINGPRCCARCHGQLHLEDVETLASGVTLDEVGGRSFADVLASAQRGEDMVAA